MPQCRAQFEGQAIGTKAATAPDNPNVAAQTHDFDGALRSAGVTNNHLSALDVDISTHCSGRVPGRFSLES